MFGYGDDLKLVNKLSKYLGYYLQMIRSKRIFKDKQIDIIAHSLGNHLLCKGIIDAAWYGIAADVFKDVNIVCFAADEAVKVYKDAIGKVVGIASSWTHYWCDSDRALSISSWTNWSGRAGTEPIRVGDFVKSIQWTNTSWKSLNHGYINEILKDKEMNRNVRESLGLP